MLTTQAADGSLVSRPLQTLKLTAEGDLVFFTAADSAKVEQLTLENEFGTAQRIRWFVRGTSAAERLTLRNGGSTLATMAGGDDRVIASSGNDSIKGGPGEDRLFGGPGHDVARGGSGTDTCREMEFKQGCELPR